MKAIHETASSWTQITLVALSFLSAISVQADLQESLSQKRGSLTQSQISLFADLAAQTLSEEFRQLPPKSRAHPTSKLNSLLEAYGCVDTKNMVEVLEKLFPKSVKNVKSNSSVLIYRADFEDVVSSTPLTSKDSYWKWKNEGALSATKPKEPVDWKGVTSKTAVFGGNLIIAWGTKTALASAATSEAEGAAAAFAAGAFGTACVVAAIIPLATIGVPTYVIERKNQTKEAAQIVATGYQKILKETIGACEAQIQQIRKSPNEKIMSRVGKDIQMPPPFSKSRTP